MAFGTVQCVTIFEKLKGEIGAFTDMQKWVFMASSKEEIEALYSSFSFDEPLTNLASSKAFLIDKNVTIVYDTAKKKKYLYLEERAKSRKKLRLC